jgi:hypothetical protein
MVLGNLKINRPEYPNLLKLVDKIAGPVTYVAAVPNYLINALKDNIHQGLS